MAITITSPVEGYTATTEFGPLKLEFVDGVTTTDQPVSEGHFAYFRDHGFGIELDAEEKNDGNKEDPFDPSKHSVEEVLAYLGGSDADHPPVTSEEWDRVKAAEAAGKARKSIADWEAAKIEGGAE